MTRRKACTEKAKLNYVEAKNMKNIGRLMILTAFHLLAATFMSEAKAAECKQIHAQITSAQITTMCTSPVNLCTAGTIDGNQGLNGTTFFTMDSIAAGPLTAPDAPATISFSGLLQITTDHGTLTTRHTGVFNTSVGSSTSGFFNSFDEVIGGTGKYQDATGFLFTGGRKIDGQFGTIVISGELCWDK